MYFHLRVNVTNTKKYFFGNGDKIRSGVGIYVIRFEYVVNYLTVSQTYTKLLLYIHIYIYLYIYEYMRNQYICIYIEGVKKDNVF